VLYESSREEVHTMILVLFMILLAVALLAPWLGADTSDAHSERAHPVMGWYPPLSPR
jgi:hypothetical protein